MNFWPPQIMCLHSESVQKKQHWGPLVPGVNSVYAVAQEAPGLLKPQLQLFESLQGRLSGARLLSEGRLVFLVSTGRWSKNRS